MAPSVPIAEDSARSSEQSASVQRVVGGDTGSYAKILRSTALIGGSSVINVAIGIVRTKAMAVLLGPAGFGLAGLYMVVAGLAGMLAGLGINSSGVRQIADAVASGDSARLARTTTVLQRCSVVLGLLGAALLVALSDALSQITFGDRLHAGAFRLLSIAVCFNLVAAGQSALIQGLGRIGDLAKMSLLGTFCGTLVAIIVVYFLRERGIVLSVVALAATTAIVSWFFCRRVEVECPALAAADVRHEAGALFRLGFAFMSSGLMTMGVAYVVRIAVLRNVGLEGAGLYQAAWTLGGLYVGVILQAMGADFYPRLTAHANDDVACNRLVNEQTRVGLLLACPGVIATLTFAPLVIGLFYSAKFAAAADTLRWICLGVSLQVLTWPMGFIMVAKKKQRLFFFSELAWTIFALSAAWIAVGAYGLTGAGIAFFASYVFHGLLVYPIVRRLSGFRPSNENVRSGLILLSCTAVVFIGRYVLSPPLETLLGGAAVVASGIYSVRALANLVAADNIPAPLRKLIAVLGLSRAQSKGTLGSRGAEVTPRG